MDLIERYLKAVGAQLPAAGRDDILAELRDLLMSRVEEREAELGRPLTEAEVEAVLREVGHPLTVAARYGAGPQHVVGPELYPWWLFGVKTALTVLVLITVVGAVARILFGGAEVGQAIGQALAGLFSSGLTVVGLATLAGFIIERQKDKPAFLTEWRAKDLGMFEVGVFSRSWWDSLGGKVDDTLADTDRALAASTPKMSPTAGALGSATAWGIFLLWWSGLLGLGFRPEDLGGELVRGGVDYGLLFADTVALLYWPVVALAAAQGVFHLIRAMTGSPVRLTAFGDVVFRGASLTLLGWIWMYSPFASLLRVDTIGAFIDRTETLFRTGDDLSTILMLIVAGAFVGEVFALIGALKKLLVGK
ncbi:hypothetical protein [Brevundimonas sp.]|uniref:HAAS signaling domain-containing protein n=1 Tax=Brevundimonas sp. TaxID=1871086 RepID=UPI001DE97C01|nr:hypothetical protein [Brevundimonas sp.]MBL0946565.1 hypothetical protein [Brevundimonas sp.]